MPYYSQLSRSRLSTCHPLLQDLFNEVIKHYDCSILEGWRDKETQDGYYYGGQSRVMWPNSYHNKMRINGDGIYEPWSCAVDAMPYPINWEDTNTHHLFIGFVLGTAEQMNIKITSGIDWDRDWDLSDTSLYDTPHFQLEAI